MKNKTALITGASTGIGKELAIIHASKSGNLVIIARNESKLNKLKQELEKKYKVKIISSINCETDNGGKNSYDVRWSGGKILVNSEEKILYHFYH